MPPATSLTFPQIISLLLFTIMMSAGQLLFKRGAMVSVAPTSLGSFLWVIANIYVVAGLCLYASATLLWLRLLQHIPLTMAYPFVALAFVIVPVAASVFLDESVTRGYWIGISLIVLGVFIASRSY